MRQRTSGTTVRALISSSALTVVPLVRWRTRHLIVTTRRLLVGEGVRGRQGIQVPLDGITAVRTRRSSLLIETAAGEELEFVDVAGAEQVREALG